jgi:hypothetical protein
LAALGNDVRAHRDHDGALVTTFGAIVIDENEDDTDFYPGTSDPTLTAAKLPASEVGVVYTGTS